MDDLDEMSSDALTAAASGKPAPVYRGNFVGSASDVATGIQQIKDPQERAHATAAFQEQANRTPSLDKTGQFPPHDGLDDFSSAALTAAARDSQPAPAPASGLHPTKAQITSPAADLTAHAVSSLVAPIAGGYAGIVGGARSLFRGEGLDKAVNAGVQASQKTTDALTYQPRTQQGAQMSEGWDSHYNPLGWIPNASSWAGQKLGGLLADNGAPGAGAIVAGAGAAAPAALGLARPLSGLLKPGEAPPAVRIEPTMDGAPAAVAPKPRYRLDSNGNPVLVPQPLPQGAPVPAGQAVNRGTPPSTPPNNQGTPPIATPNTPPRPTLAQASPEIQSAVAKVQDQGTVPNKDVLARHLDADTLPVPVQLTKGQATMDPALISDEMNSRGRPSAPVPPTFYNAQGKALVANLDAVKAKVAPNIGDTHPTGIGQSLVDEYKTMDAPVRADISAKYKALADANGGDLPVNGQDFVSAADASLNKINRARFVPSEVKSMLEDYRQGGPMSFNDFENMRTILAAEERKAQRSGDGNAGMAIGAVRDALESLPMSSETSAIKPLADAARRASASRFARIKADPAYAAAVGDSVPAGQPSPLADQFVRNFIINGKAANVKQMKNNLGGSPTAQEAIGAAGVDYLSRIAKADRNAGTFAADAYNSGIRQLGPKLDDIFGPESSQTVQQIGRVAKYTNVQPKGSYVNNSNSAVAYLADKAKDAAEGVVNVKAGGFPLGTLVRRGLDGRAAKKAAAESIAPAAGIDSPSK